MTSDAIIRHMTGDMPENSYALIGRPLFDPHRDEHLAEIRNASRALLPYQNHEDPEQVQRALKLQHELARAAHVFGNHEELAALNRELLTRIRQRMIQYVDDESASGRGLDANHVRQWLLDQQRVHPAVVDAVQAAVNSGDFDACLAAIHIQSEPHALHVADEIDLSALGESAIDVPKSNQKLNRQQPAADSAGGHGSSFDWRIPAVVGAMLCIGLVAIVAVFAGAGLWYYGRDTSNGEQTQNYDPNGPGPISETAEIVLGDHAGEITSISWSPEGQLLAVSDLVGSVRIWDTKTGTQQPGPATPFPDVRELSWSPTGTQLAVELEGGTLHIIDIETGDSSAFLASDSGRVDAAWSPDGKYMATAYDDRLSVWNVADHVELARAAEVTAVKSVAWSPDGRAIVASGQGLEAVGHVVFFFDLEKHTRVELPQSALHLSAAKTLTWRNSSALSARSDPSATVMLFARFEENVLVWNLEEGPPKAALEIPASSSIPIKNLAISTDGRTLVLSQEGRVELQAVDPDIPRELIQPSVTETYVHAVDWSPSDPWVAAARDDGTIGVWDCQAYAPIATFRTTEPSLVVRWRPDGTSLASGYSDGQIRIWKASRKSTPRPRLTADVKSLLPEPSLDENWESPDG